MKKAFKHITFATVMACAISFAAMPFSQPFDWSKKATTQKATKGMKTTQSKDWLDAGLSLDMATLERKIISELKVQPVKPLKIKKTMDKLTKFTIPIIKVSFKKPQAKTTKESKQPIDPFAQIKEKKVDTTKKWQDQIKEKKTEKLTDCALKALKDQMKMNGPTLAKADYSHCVKKYTTTKKQKPTSQPTSRPTSQPTKASK